MPGIQFPVVGVCGARGGANKPPGEDPRRPPPRVIPGLGRWFGVLKSSLLASLGQLVRSATNQFVVIAAVPHFDELANGLASLGAVPGQYRYIRTSLPVLKRLVSTRV